jgi:hypothetical protein
VNKKDNLWVLGNFRKDLEVNISYVSRAALEEIDQAHPPLPVVDVTVAVPNKKRKRKRSVAS